jgi:hypothetical protein
MNPLSCTALVHPFHAHAVGARSERGHDWWRIPAEVLAFCELLVFPEGLVCIHLARAQPERIQDHFNAWKYGSAVNGRGQLDNSHTRDTHTHTHTHTWTHGDGHACVCAPIPTPALPPAPAVPPPNTPAPHHAGPPEQACTHLHADAHTLAQTYTHVDTHTHTHTHTHTRKRQGSDGAHYLWTTYVLPMYYLCTTYVSLLFGAGCAACQKFTMMSRHRAHEQSLGTLHRFFNKTNLCVG